MLSQKLQLLFIHSEQMSFNRLSLKKKPFLRLHTIQSLKQSQLIHPKPNIYQIHNCQNNYVNPYKKMYAKQKINDEKQILYCYEQEENINDFIFKLEQGLSQSALNPQKHCLKCSKYMPGSVIPQNQEMKIVKFDSRSWKNVIKNEVDKKFPILLLFNGEDSERAYPIQNQNWENIQAYLKAYYSCFRLQVGDSGFIFCVEINKKEGNVLYHQCCGRTYHQKENQLLDKTNIDRIIVIVILPQNQEAYIMNKKQLENSLNIELLYSGDQFQGNQRYYFYRSQLPYSQKKQKHFDMLNLLNEDKRNLIQDIFSFEVSLRMKTIDFSKDAWRSILDSKGKFLKKFGTQLKEVNKQVEFKDFEQAGFYSSCVYSKAQRLVMLPYCQARISALE